MKNRGVRADLTLTITEATLKGKSLGIRLTRQERKEAEDKFAANLYDCLNWLLIVLETGVPKDIDNLKEKLAEHLEFYIEALFRLKKQVEDSKDLRNHKSVIKLVHCYIDDLIKKISS